MRKLLSILRSTSCTLAVLAGVALLPQASQAETPEQFAHRFADFKYEFHAEVQPSDVFLKTKTGDCDDFATVADDALTREGYTTHLITVRMSGQAHVVLYVDEVHGYLDYNFRNSKKPVLPCGSSLEEIAKQVAGSFHVPWVAAYEFNYHHHTKHLVTDIVKNDEVPSVASAKPMLAVAGQHTVARK